VEGVLHLIILRAAWVAAVSSSTETNWNKMLPCFQREIETERDKDRIMSAAVGNMRSLRKEGLTKT